MKIDKKFTTISTKFVDYKDETYRFSSDAEFDSLSASIQQVGLVNPLIVQQKGEARYRIVCGFRRLRALEFLCLERFPAFVIRDQKPSDALFLLAISDNQSVRALNPIELSRILHKLSFEFNVTADEIVATWLPQLGYGRNPRVLKLYANLHTLPPEWQSAIIEDQIPLDFAQDMLQRTDEERTIVLEIIRTLRLGKNRQREFTGLLFDVARIQNMALAQLVDSEPVRSLLHATKHTPSQKAEFFKQWLWENRYPRYSETRARFDSILQKAKLPPNISLQAPPFFEGESFSVGFSFSSEQNYNAALKVLSAVNDHGLVKELAEILC